MAIDIGEIISRIQSHVFPRRVRCKEFFTDYDPLRSGRVTKPQFVRAVGLMGVRLSEAEADALADCFAEEGARIQKPQIVNYFKCCERVDEVFVIPRLEKAPHAEIASPGSSLPPTFRAADVQDKDRLDYVLHRLALLVKTRGVVLKYCFQDFERSDATSLTLPRRSGKVTVEQFWRCFPFIKDLEKEDVELIISRYSTSSGDVHYQQLHDDISEIVSNEPPPFPKSTLVLRPDDAKWSQQQHSAVQKIQARVVERRVRLSDQFQDFDPLRKGFCTVGQVKTVFTILKLEVSTADFDELTRSYTREDGMFCYAAFCHEIDQAFTCVGIEKNPMVRIQMPDSSSTVAARRNRIELTAEEKAWVEGLEEKIKARTQVRRILLRTMFQDFDSIKRGHVTKGQFTRVMHMLGFELDEAHTTLLCRMYCDLGNHREFNYLDFCASCDPPTENERLAIEQTSKSYDAPQPSKYFNMNGRVEPLNSARSGF